MKGPTEALWEAVQAAGNGPRVAERQIDPRQAWLRWVRSFLLLPCSGKKPEA